MAEREYNPGDVSGWINDLASAIDQASDRTRLLTDYWLDESYRVWSGAIREDDETRTRFFATQVIVALLAAERLRRSVLDLATPESDTNG